MEELRYDSTVDRWPGYVMLPAYLPFQDLISWNKALKKMGLSGENSNVEVDLDVMYEYVLPLICKLVRRWEIVGLTDPVTADTFPGSPALLTWLFESVMDLFQKTNAPIDPNSQGQP